MSADLGDLLLHAARGRRNVLRMLEAHPAGHLGGAMSAMDIIVAIYFHAMPSLPHPQDPHRDRFLLSAGHKAMAQYAVLAEAGIISEGALDTYGALNSPLPGHPDMHVLPGIEANTGALGHGLPIACGMAMGLKMKGSSARVFTVMGDGELPEGSNWEGAAIAAHHELENLVAVVDLNGLQISGPTKEVMDMTSVADKFRAFGWATREIDGNDMTEVVRALDACPLEARKPSVIVARTVKGVGVSSVAGTLGSHYWKPDKEQLAEAVEESDAALSTAMRATSASNQTKEIK